MRQKRSKKENHKTLNSIGEDEALEITGKEGKGFFACYLLTSLSPRHKGQTYIGFTVNPKRRIRQHNGEITSGAYRTKRKRPWEMVLCIYGFPTNVSALQFEWAWQHPRESLAVREAAMSFKSFSGVASKIKLAYTMLNLKAWNSLNLTVNYFSTKYAHHGGVCPSLPLHMKVQVCPMDDLPCYSNSQSEEEDEEEGDDGSDQSQPWDDLYQGEKELNNRYLEKAKEPVDDDRLANFTGFGLLEETVEDEEVSLSGVRSFKSMENEPETVLDEDRLANFPGFGLVEEIVEDEETSHSSGGSIETMEKEPVTVEDEALRSIVGSIEVMEKEPETVFNDRLANFSGFGLEDSVEEEFTEECWRRQKPMSSTTEVEVIDLMTPSPSCRVGTSKKRRRVSEFIDLTKSPNFIELL